ncbi:MAG: sulfite exporter TauE/SafE family protein [Bacteroidales bacterium]|nr:MAG: sulfite exporter TauE/SafE family protein [Bacteroidales bacterium]
MEIALILILLIVFIAGLTRATFGFGDALVGMPLLTIVAGIQTATPLIQMFGTTIAISILIRQWKKVDLRSAWRLIISSLLGIPVGLYYLKEVNEDLVKLILACLIVLFALYQLFRPRIVHLKTDRFAIFFGFLGGILGGAYNTNGPPVIFYGTLRKWDPGHFRATLQGYFLPTGVGIMAGHILAGLWTPVVIRYYLLALPVAIAAIIVGNFLNRRIPGEQFIKYVYVLLIALGLVLILDVIR